MTVVGTRPEIIRLSRIIPELDKAFDHQLVHTGQNSHPKLSDIFFEELGLRRPDTFLGVDNSSPIGAIAQTMTGVEAKLLETKHDAVLVLGDTNSAFALMAAKRLGVATFHMEAGNRSFDENVPEEINRRIIDHTADFNLPYNRYSMQNLLREGLEPRKIFISGSPLFEVFRHYGADIEGSQVLSELSLREGEYILASFHRQENVDSQRRLAEILRQLEELADHYGYPIVVSTHPRTSKRLRELSWRGSEGKISFLEPFGFFDYCKLQSSSFCVISDSGTVSEESYILGFPAVTLRDSMERQEALDVGSITMAAVGGNSLGDAVEMARRNRDSGLTEPEGYSRHNVSSMVANLIMSVAPLHKKWANLHRD